VFLMRTGYEQMLASVYSGKSFADCGKGAVRTIPIR
jgi:hypothetical protein